MSYKVHYDRSNRFTPQQRHIIEAREKEEKRRKEEAERKAKEETEKE